jgi:predicted PurR-regulated permease PerM
MEETRNRAAFARSLDGRPGFPYSQRKVESLPDALPPSSPERGPGSFKRRAIFLAAAGAAILAILWVFREVLAPFLLALVVAYVLAPVVDWMERVRVAGRKPPRWVSVLVLYVTLLGALGTAIGVGAPVLVREIQGLSRELPNVARNVRDEWLPAVDRAIRSASVTLGASEPDEPVEPVAPEGQPAVGAAPVARSIEVLPREGGGFEVVLPESGVEIRREGDDRFVVRPAVEVQEQRRDLSVQLTEAIQHELQSGERSIAGALRTAQSWIAAVVGGIFRFFIMLMLSAYLLITSDSIFAFFRTLVHPDRRGQWDTLLRRIDRGLAGVVRGQLVICLVNGVLSGIGFYIAGLEYWPVLTLIATVLSIIPIFGAWLSSVPAVIVGLQNGPGTVAFVLIWIVGIHQIEANLLNPKIMGDAAKVHPVLVIFALLAGEHFFGILGALLAVPILSIGQSLFLHFREIALGVPASERSSLPPAIPTPPPAVADPTPAPEVAPPPPVESSSQP